MYLGTMESNFARSIALLIAFGIIMFALQGIILPEASYYGQILLIGFDLIRVMQFIGLGAGVLALISIWADIKWLQRLSYAFICWFYMTFVFVLIWMVGLQAPSVIFSITTVLVSGAIYGYLTQKGKNDANIDRCSNRKNKVRKSVPVNNTSTGTD